MKARPLTDKMLLQRFWRICPYWAESSRKHCSTAVVAAYIARQITLQWVGIFVAILSGHILCQQVSTELAYLCKYSREMKMTFNLFKIFFWSDHKEIILPRKYLQWIGMNLDRSGRKVGSQRPVGKRHEAPNQMNWFL